MSWPTARIRSSKALTCRSPCSGTLSVAGTEGLSAAVPLPAAPSNFDTRLEPADPEPAPQRAADPHVLVEVLARTRRVAECDLDRAFTDCVADTLRDVGAGYALVGRQVPSKVDGADVSPDLLSVHGDRLRYAPSNPGHPMAVSTCTREFLPSRKQRSLPGAASTNKLWNCLPKTVAGQLRPTHTGMQRRSGSGGSWVG